MMVRTIANDIQARAKQQAYRYRIDDVPTAEAAREDVKYLQGRVDKERWEISWDWATGGDEPLWDAKQHLHEAANVPEGEGGG